MSIQSIKELLYKTQQYCLFHKSILSISFLPQNTNLVEVSKLIGHYRENISMKSTLWLIACVTVILDGILLVQLGFPPCESTSSLILTLLKNGAFLTYLFTAWKKRRDRDKSWNKG